MHFRNVMETQFLYRLVILIILVINVNCQHPSQKAEEGKALALTILMDFYAMFDTCVTTPMSKQKFLTDNLKGLVNDPSKTTVGLAKKFTSNRKFFANMVTTPAFKDMLAKDEDLLRKNLIDKYKYCDGAVMNQELLKDFYDRESDQNKI